MSNHGYSAANILEQLPRVLAEDRRMAALAAAIAKALMTHLNELPLAEIYTRIDSLPEAVLDILAKDFKIDWYDYDYPIEAKRNWIKTNYYVHRSLGTAGAIKEAIRAIYPDSDVEEWFNYGGNPFYFKVVIDLTNAIPSPEGHAQVLSRINTYKNLRSHVQEIKYIYRPHEDEALRFGGCMATIVSIPMEES